MRRFGRRSTPMPDDVAEALGVRSGQRVLAWSPLVGGGAAAATIEGLLISTPRGEVISRTWIEVDHAAWDGPSATLGVWWVGTRQSIPLEIEDDSRLPVVIRERVQSSVVLTAAMPVAGGREVRLALRKDSDGVMSTQVIAPPGVHLDDPDVAARISQGLSELRADAGVGPGDVRTEHAPGFDSL